MKSPEIKSQLGQRSAKDIESQKLDQPGGDENFYDTAGSAMNRALQILSAGLGDIKTGTDENGHDYFRIKFNDFEFYTIYPREIDMLRTTQKNSKQTYK